MITFSLQSGSNGNAIYVEAGDARLLIDAGIPARTAEGRMRVRGRDIRDVDALLISHDHADHVRCAGVYQRRFKMPLFMSRRTQRAISCDLGPLTDVRHFRAGERLWIKGVVIHTLPTPHDAVDGVAFVIEHGGKRLGILTDLGYTFDALHRWVPTLHAAYLESNYDPAMLEGGPYPRRLKDRIRGEGGHLSNMESALLARDVGSRLQWIALAHLSAENNLPDLAMDTHREVVGQLLPLTVASRHDVSEVMEV